MKLNWLESFQLNFVLGDSSDHNSHLKSFPYFKDLYKLINWRVTVKTPKRVIQLIMVHLGSYPGESNPGCLRWLGYLPKTCCCPLNESFRASLKGLWSILGSWTWLLSFFIISRCTRCYTLDRLPRYHNWSPKQWWRKETWTWKTIVSSSFI